MKFQWQTFAKNKMRNGACQLSNCKRISTRFRKFNQLILIEVKNQGNAILNTLNKYKSATFQLVPVDLLFSSGIKDTTEQIFITVNGLNNPKISLIDGKILNILALAISSADK